MQTSPVMLSIVLDVTVSASSWSLTYGTEAAEDLADYLANAARYVNALTCVLDDPGTLDGADVRLVASEALPDGTGPGTRGWPDADCGCDRVGVRVTLNVPVDAARWRARFGGDPVEQVGVAMAAELGAMSPARTEWAGEFAYRRELSGVAAVVSDGTGRG